MAPSIRLLKVLVYTIPLLGICSLGLPAQPAPLKEFISTAASGIPSSELLSPSELAKMVTTSQADGLVILQVGSHVLYAQAHIPGSEYVGAGGQESGLQALRDRVETLKKGQFIVIYCGCCPWDRCPNIRPAYEEMRKLGFTHVKVLYLDQNFGADWVDKGYPVAKGR